MKHPLVRARLSLVAALLVLAGTIRLAPAAAIQEVGFAAPGQTAFEFVGQTEVRDTSVTVYGYLTSLAGLPPAALFADPAAPSEATARFTYFGHAELTARTTRDRLSVISSSGELTIYLHDTPNATFAVPESFFGGTAVAAGNVRFQDIVADQAPAPSLATGEGDFTQIWEGPFTLQGQQLRLARVGLQERLATTGVSARSSQTPSLTVFIVAGRAVVTGVAPATPLAEPSRATASPAAAQRVTVRLGELNHSGISGTAVLTPVGDQTRVVITARGATGGHPAHIHRGTCTDLDPNPLFPLHDVDRAGHSDTTVPIRLEDLTRGTYAINVHRSAADIGTYVMCGEIGGGS